MTTVAYRDGFLAADDQGTFNNLKVRIRKIYVINGVGAIGFSGDCAAIVKTASWWIDGRSTDPPDHGDGDGCEGLLVTKDGLFFLSKGVTPIQLYDEFFAIGSGTDFAMSAMSLGKNAKEAVEFASKFDAFTSDTVDVTYCPNHWKKRRR